MIDNSLKDAYTNLLKDNTRLHAEKKQIADSAEKAIRNASDVIDKLHKIVDSLITEAISIVQDELPESNEKTTVIVRLKRLTPLKIGSDGNEILK